MLRKPQNRGYLWKCKHRRYVTKVEINEAIFVIDQSLLGGIIHDLHSYDKKGVKVML